MEFCYQNLFRLRAIQRITATIMVKNPIASSEAFAPTLYIPIPMRANAKPMNSSSGRNVFGFSRFMLAY